MPKKATPKNSKKKDSLKGLKHPTEYEQFIEWIALPQPYRKPGTQEGMAKELGVGQDTLSEWKQRDGFWEAVKEKRMEWGRERTPAVILGLYQKAKTEGNSAEVKLWIQYFEGFAETTVHSIPELEKIADTLEKIAKENYGGEDKEPSENLV